MSRFDRIFFRWKCPFKLNFEISSSGERGTGMGSDISIKGIGFFSERSFQQGEILKIQITLPYLKQPVHAEAEVRFQEDIKNARRLLQYQIGAQFTKIEDQDQETIGNLIEDKISFRLLRCFILTLGSIAYVALLLRIVSFHLINGFKYTAFGNEWLKNGFPISILPALWLVTRHSASYY